MASASTEITVTLGENRQNTPPITSELSTSNEMLITQVDVLKNLRVYGGYDIASEVTESCAEYGDDIGVEGLSRKTLLTLGLGPLGPLKCPVEKFLNRIPTVRLICDLVLDVPKQEERLRLYPGDADITAAFKSRSIDSRKNDSAKERWALLLYLKHTIQNKDISQTFFGNKDCGSYNYIIVEDMLERKTLKAHKFTRGGFSKYCERTMAYLAQMPQQNNTVKDCGVTGIRRELEGIAVPIYFDYRLMCFVIGRLFASYLARGEINVDPKDPAALKINVCGNSSIVDGELVYSRACGGTEVEMNTFCLLAGYCCVNSVVLLADRMSSNTKMLAGFSLYNYLCKLFKNIIHSSNLYGCGVEHMWAMMAGMHSVLKVYAHSDEGGLMRTLLSNPIYPPCCGVLQEATKDVLTQSSCHTSYFYYEKRQLLDFLLFFPNAVCFGDSGVEDMSFFMPTVYHRALIPKRDPNSYNGLIDGIFVVLENMRTIMAKVFNLEAMVSTQFSVYSNAIKLLKHDRHLENQIIIPFQWLDPAISNFYNLSTVYRDEKLSYYSDATIPFFPPATTTNFPNNKNRTYMLVHDVADFNLPMHTLRDYGYAYMLNPRYNECDGLSTMFVVDDGHIPNKTYVQNRFLYTNGDYILGKNKWTMPHCSINNYYEMFPVVDTYTVRLLCTLQKYFPNPEIMLTDKLDQIHTLSRLSVTNTAPKRTKHGRYVNTTMKRIFDVHLAKTLLFRQSDIEEGVSIKTIQAIVGNIQQTSDYDSGKLVGKVTKKINNAEKTENALQLEANLKTSLDSELSLKRNDTEPISKDSTEFLDKGNFYSVSNEGIQMMMDSGEIFSPTSSPHNLLRNNSLGDSKASEEIDDCYILMDELHEINNDSLGPADYEWADRNEARSRVTSILGDVTLTALMQQQVGCYSVPNDYQLVDIDKCDSATRDFVKSSMAAMREKNMVPLKQVHELGYCGKDSDPRVRLLRILAIHRGRREGKFVSQLAIADITQLRDRKPMIRRQAVVDMSKHVSE